MKVANGDFVRYPVASEKLLKGRVAVKCGRCELRITAGAPYAERLKEMRGSTPIVNIVCVYCDLIEDEDEDGEDR